jgi:hypothetical protein
MDSAPPHTAFTRRLGREMEDPVSRRLVLPLTRFEQVAHDGYRSRATDALGPLDRARKTEYLMATCREDLDQLRANESLGSRDKRGGHCVAWHAASVEYRPTGDHPQRPHRTRTTPVRRQ